MAPTCTDEQDRGIKSMQARRAALPAPCSRCVLARKGARSAERRFARLQDAMRIKKRLFVCGLALDFCVLDTCLNAGSSQAHTPFKGAP